MECSNAVLRVAMPEDVTQRNTTIRRGVPADARLLAELAASTYRETFAAEYRPDELARHLGREYGASQQEAELANPDIFTLLAEVNGQLAGYAQVRAHAVPDCVRGSAPLELWRFFVAARWHGGGVAQRLMDGVATEARARKARTLWLGVWEHNHRAQAFYRKCGFLDVGSQVYRLDGEAQTDRVMARSL